MPRLRAFLKLLGDEGERDLGHLTPSIYFLVGTASIPFQLSLRA